MKKYVFLLNFLVFLVSCNDNEKRNNSENPMLEESNLDGNRNGDNYTDLNQGNQDNNNNSEDGINDDKESANGFAGLYKKVGAEGKSENCNCYCLDLVFGNNFEVCLVPGKIDISVSSKKTGNNTANLFLVAPIESQIPEEEIPWDTFSRNIPIAKLEHLPDGSLKLDWIGFSVDGELAVDYAIFGKKTLEGTYKKSGS